MDIARRSIRPGPTLCTIGGLLERSRALCTDVAHPNRNGGSARHHASLSTVPDATGSPVGAEHAKQRGRLGLSFRSASRPTESVETMGVDRPERDVEESPSTPSGWRELESVVARLRDPERGCPWDLEQTPSSLAPYLIEEAHEAAEALRRGDSDASCDELGDVLLNVFLQARVAEEEERFTLEDVARRAADKVIRRHPHVWGDVDRTDREAIRENWHRIKQEEAASASSAKADSEPESALRPLPPTLPALTRATRQGADAARIGFDWPDWTGPHAKVEEEWAEVREAVGNPVECHREIGDLLLAATSLARHLDVDPESALEDAMDRFRSRFHVVERGARELSRPDLAQLEALWQRAKGEPPQA